MRQRRREVAVLGAAALAAACAGAVVGVLGLQSQSGAAQLLSARFRDLEGRNVRLLDWQGRALVCNFWATWCAPCREEVPLLVAAKQQRAAANVEIVGIGIDTVTNISEFARTFKINYPLLVGDATAIALMRNLGNRAGALPYTVVLNTSGAVVRRHLGVLTASDLRQVLDSLVG